MMIARREDLCETRFPQVEYDNLSKEKGRLKSEIAVETLKKQSLTFHKAAIMMNQESPSLEEKLQLNAELVIEHLSRHAGFTLGFDEESVAWVDGFIERQRSREEFDAASIEGLVNNLGSFLGECLRRELGGKWKHESNGQLAVQFDDGNAAFPFNKVRKQFANGESDSILSFYQSSKVIFPKS